MSQRFVLSGYFGFKNFGDEIILSVLINKLRKYNAQIAVISSDPEYTKAKFNDIAIIKTFDIFKIINYIAKSDFLISGGGSLLQDVTSLKSLFYYLFVIFIAQMFRKKVIIFAQGIGPIKSNLGKILTKKILKRCEYISVRDKNSQKLLYNWGIASDVLCDPAFTIKAPTVLKENSVAVQLRDFYTVTDDFINKLAYKVTSEFNDFEIKIYPLQQNLDLKTCIKFENALKSYNPNIKTTIFNNLCEEELILHIAKSEYLIAMRFHAIIAGIISGVKTLGINYDIKVEKLCQEYNLPYIELDKEIQKEFEQLKNLDIQQIIKQTKENEFDWSGFDKAINNL